MRDAISHARVDALHPLVRKEVLDTLIEVEKNFPPNIKIRVVQGLRTIEEQNELYAQGRTKPGKVVTNARGGKSYHNFGLAFDYALMYDKNNDGNFEVLSWDINKDEDKDKLKDWDEVRKAFEAKGWKWGGTFRTFKDYPHLEKSFNLSTSTLYNMYINKVFISGTKYVRI
jgi:peptidoglycan L-alanyl-D-glutamate endopeptidase CwlK